jgi:uncharacterized DUF497 family protein
MPAEKFEIFDPGFIAFEWDEAKRAINIGKHRVNFVDVLPVFAGALCRKRSDRQGETRFLVVGVLNDVEIAVIYTQREKGVCRIISARRARIEERRAYRALFS